LYCYKQESLQAERRPFFCPILFIAQNSPEQLRVAPQSEDSTLWPRDRPMPAFLCGRKAAPDLSALCFPPPSLLDPTPYQLPIRPRWCAKARSVGALIGTSLLRCLSFLAMMSPPILSPLSTQKIFYHSLPFLQDCSVFPSGRGTSFPMYVILSKQLVFL